jgi:hypothetical protein
MRLQINAQKACDNHLVFLAHSTSPSLEIAWRKSNTRLDNCPMQRKTVMDIHTDGYGGLRIFR